MKKNISKTERAIKRVACLYRVSTAKQVDKVKDDIPMQREACHAFAEEHGWMIVMEKYEKGVSGYKVSAENRDAIQDLKEAAMKQEFDILLVFMFDRLGRMQNETPFVVKWFADQGIEVWSVNEGEQRFESSVDDLMNFIRFWQASGESQKTSIRVKTRLGQMTSEGIYTGGVRPYGYRLAYKGRKNKKGQEMRDLEIDPAEADVVKLIFHKTVLEGYGSHRLAEYLNEKGYKTPNGAEFHSSYVLRVLKNPIYHGFLEKGDAKSERIEELQIISDSDFFRAQEIVQQRANKSDEKRNIAMTNKSVALLSGNIYCAHCGCRLATSRYHEDYKKKDGTVTHHEYGRYVCYHRSRGLNDCDGASTYKAERIDAAVILMIHTIFSSITGCPAEEKIELAYKNMIADNHQQQMKLNYDLKKNRTQLENLRMEIGRVLTGESIYNQEDLAIAIDTLRKKITSDEATLAALQEEEAEKKAYSANIIPAYKRFKTWADEFDSASFETQKMIANQLFSRVEVGKNYDIRVKLDVTYQNFCDNWLTSHTLTATA